jgi:hypothetical protein
MGLAATGEIRPRTKSTCVAKPPELAVDGLTGSSWMTTPVGTAWRTNVLATIDY